MASSLRIWSVTWLRWAAHNSFTYWVGKTCVIHRERYNRFSQQAMATALGEVKSPNLAIWHEALKHRS
jgi:hypothetical protein